MTRLFYIATVAVLLGGLAGCIGPGQGWVKTYQTSEPFFSTPKVEVIQANYDAADAMADRLGNKIPHYSPIYSSPFINLEDRADQTPFGIVVSEQVSDRLTQHGWAVRTGTAPTSAMPAPAEGEHPPVPVRLSGTYVVSEDTIFVSARVVRAEDATVIEGADWTLPVNSDLGSLLSTTGQGGTTPTVHTQFVPAEQEPQPRRAELPSYMHPASPTQSPQLQEMNEMNILQQ